MMQMVGSSGAGTLPGTLIGMKRRLPVGATMKFMELVARQSTKARGKEP